ncbi:GMP synthase (glutamine-hydrolysing) [Gammaproteobacteria bacterium]
MRAHCFQHESFEEMSAIETWLKEKSFEISISRFFESDELPDISTVDWLIIMGGSMSVNDEQKFPWLIQEKKFIKKCITQGKVVIGTCLGSQLIASSLGAKVYKNNQKEIGWFPIRRVLGSDPPHFKTLPMELTVFHWHGETFDLPQGAMLVASSECCKNQIFLYGDKTVGFQCHFETTLDSLSSITNACRSELEPARFIQSEMEMIKNEPIYAPQMHKAVYDILEFLFLISIG